MTNGVQDITRSPLGRKEAQFLAKIGIRRTFSMGDARRVLGHKDSDPTRQFLERLQTKGWTKRIKRGRFAVIPLSSGENRSPQLHEFIVDMELKQLASCLTPSPPRSPSASLLMVLPSVIQILKERPRSGYHHRLPADAVADGISSQTLPCRAKRHDAGHSSPLSL